MSLLILSYKKIEAFVLDSLSPSFSYYLLWGKRGAMPRGYSDSLWGGSSCEELRPVTIHMSELGDRSCCSQALRRLKPRGQIDYDLMTDQNP